MDPGDVYAVGDAPAGEGYAVIRAEEVVLSRAPHPSSARNEFRGRVTDVATLGALLIILIRQSIRTLHFDQNYEWIIIGCAIIVAVVTPFSFDLHLGGVISRRAAHRKLGLLQSVTSPGT